MNSDPADDTATLADWLASLPLDGSDSDRSRGLEAQIAARLTEFDRGDELDRRMAAYIRQLMNNVNQRRASRRGEN